FRLLVASALCGIVAPAFAAAPRDAAGNPLGAPSTPRSAAAAGIGRALRLPVRTAVDGRSAAAPVAGAKLTVLALVAEDCPVAAKLAPTLAGLEDAYARRGVRFVFVDPSPLTTNEQARSLARRVGWNGPLVREPDQRWTRAIGATTTTEAVVLDAAGKVVYRGAVDDQYAVGATLAKPRHRWLADALDAALAGRAPAVAATTAPGCALPTPEANGVAAVPTYHAKIQHVVQKHCVPCHRKDGVGPFVLDNYAALKARAPMIKRVVDAGTMPPWFAAKGTGPWRSDPSIPEEDKAALRAWADGGMPRGDAKLAPEPPVFEGSWTLGKPDQIFTLPNPVAVKATGYMDYVNIDVPTGFAEDKWVQKIEVLPGDRRVVHHVLVFLRRPGANGIFGVGNFEEVRGFFGAYAPGNGALAYPGGLAKRIPKGSILRFQIHYTPNGTATTDQSRLGLTFAKGPVEREVHTTSLANLWFSIPPGAENHEVVARLRLPKDATILSYFPHSHVRGKAARYEKVDAEGKTTLLLDVPKYDFNWQLGYVYERPIDVKAGEE
ncbi:MAG: redoxin family protein, partial [Armatimonadota bacterium]